MPRPQTTIAVLGSSAGAGGAVLSACFEVVLARPSINFNYHYGAMGLSGSELRSFVLPLPGKQATERLLTDRLPVSPTTAQRLGLVDAIGPDDPDAFDRWARQVATPLADRPPGRPHALPAAGAGRHVARHLQGSPRLRPTDAASSTCRLSGRPWANTGAAIREDGQCDTGLGP